MTKTYTRPQLVDRGSAVEQTLQSAKISFWETDEITPTEHSEI